MRDEFQYNDIITVVRGQHAGRTGMYDDDAGGGRIVVIVSALWDFEYIVVPRRLCIPAPQAEREAYVSQFQNDIAERQAFNRLRTRSTLKTTGPL